MSSLLFDDSGYTEIKEEVRVTSVDSGLKKKVKSRDKGSKSGLFTGFNLLSYYTLFSPLCNADYNKSDYVNFKIRDVLSGDVYDYREGLMFVSDGLNIGLSSALGFIMLCVHVDFGHFVLDGGILRRVRESNVFNLSVIRDRVYGQFVSDISIPSKYRKREVSEGYCRYCRDRALGVGGGFFEGEYY